jgi:serine/threonine-protein kinase
LCPSCERSTGIDRPDGTIASSPLEQTSFEPPFPDALAPSPTAVTRSLDGAVGATVETGDPLTRRLPPGYDPLEVLGRGGMGLVLKAWERAAERVVAVKLIRTLPDREALERFRIEAKALAGLKHPNLVQVLTVAVDAPDPYFTMEFVEGGGLDRLLKSGGPLPIDQAIRIIEAAARGVAAAHAAGIVHRDLKPGNVLLAADGTPKVTDFGLAKRYDRNDPELTVSGALVGTPNYMAPEQAGRKNLAVAEPADVYGLGATLYHLLTGKAPFRGENQTETIENVLKKPPVAPRKLRPEIPADLEAVILKCLEKEPADRYQSALALADDLVRVREGQKPVGPSGRVVRVWRQVRRNGLRVAIVAVVVALAAVAVYRAWPQQPADAQAEIRKQLAAGHEVVIIPESGVPPWLRESWLIGPTALEPSPSAENACSFESLDQALLAVLRDPGIDRYRVRFDVRILRTKLVHPADPPGLPDLGEVAGRNVGVFFGHSQAGGVDGSVAHAFFAVKLIDYFPKEVKAARITQGFVKLEPSLIYELPDRPHDTWSGSASAPLRFPPSQTLPGEWRRIQIEVSPERVCIDWADQPGQPLKRLAELPAEDVHRHYSTIQGKFDSKHPQARISLPGWQPRMPLGVWSRGAGVAVRNVTIAPLP